MKKTITLLLCLALLLCTALPVCAADCPALTAETETAYIQKYGNVGLSLTREELLEAGYAYGDVVTVEFLDQTMVLPLCSNYTDVDSGEPALFARENDARVCLAINMGDFATTYGLAVKTTHEDKSFEWNWAEGVAGPVSFTIRMKEPGGYLDAYLLHQLRYTDERADYPGLSDAEFANFRAVETAGMGKGVLYRTASPVNPEHNRSAYADAAIRAAGVTVVMNLADDEATVRAYPGFGESYYATTEFIALNMGVDFAAADFREKLAEGLRFFAAHPGVYAVHCTEGKDRAGFVVAVLECLMGASWQEVAADYMQTFYNYYGVTPDDARYDAVLNSGIVKSISRAFGVSDPQSADLSALAAAYLRDCGLTDETLAALKRNLSAAPAADDGILTRGEFVTGLFGVSGDAETAAAQDAYDDVPAEGALAQAVRWATDSGVVNGYGRRRFGPDDPVTREQMVTMLYRCACALEQAPTGEWMFPLGFEDSGDVSAWADKAMQWAVMNQIIIGTGSGLEPKATATDAQLAIVLDRWTDFLVPEGGDRGAMILYTSDVHCGIADGFGYAGLEEVRGALRAQGYDVLLVDDGDNIQGGPLGTMTKGEALTELMDRMGYDVAIPGNHEFDYTVERFLSLAEQADFPYISSNFNYKGELLFDPYVICESAGKKIAFVGVTTPKTLTTSTPAYFKDASGALVYGFLEDETGESVYAAVQSAADAARAEGADYVIVLGHLGYYAESAPWTYADVITHTTGVDALLDGHSHDTEQATVKNAEGRDVLRSACGTKLACIGWCRIPADGELSAGLYTWNDSTPAAEKYGIDNEMSRAVAQAAETLEEAFGAVVAHTAVALTINDPTTVDASGKPVRMVRRAETNLGDLCADAYRAQAGADIALVNGGGVRDNIAAGDITLRSVYNVHPYGNSLCMIEATGQMILDALEWGARAVPGESGGFLQVSGLSYEIDAGVPTPCVADFTGMCAEISGTRRVKNVLVGGEPIDPEKTYTLAGHDYMLLQNGDGFTMFDGAPLLLNCVKLDNQVLIDYITETLGGEIGADYADPCGLGRITVTEHSEA